MFIPQHIIEGLGAERVTRIRMAWDFALTKVPSLREAERQRLAEIIMRESRDDRRLVGEIALRAVRQVGRI